jgi:hypothetical protein
MHMTDQSPTANAVAAALQNLRARRPRPRGRRQELAPYVDQLRELLAVGWTRSEIIGEIKALGGKMSPALLRDVLQMAPVKPQKVNHQRQAKPLPPASPPPAAEQAAATAPADHGQPADDAE